MQTQTQRKKARKAKRAQSLPLPKTDEFLATMERRDKQGGVICEAVCDGNKVGASRLRHRAKCECLLDSYLMQGKINAVQMKAAMRFRAAWLTSAEGIKTRDSSQVCIGGGDTMAALEKLTYSEQVLGQAYDALRGSQSQGLVVVSVCGQDQAAGDDKRLKTLLRGLDVLVALWGL